MARPLNVTKAEFSADDQRHMNRAVMLAHQGRFWARPNPHVGCVIAHGSAVFGEGFTQPAGGPHAESVALSAAGSNAEGATAFVTLEPCSHHGRTPPCAEALISAGVSRVVVALEDPNPRVAGQGIHRLREAGVTVEVGLLSHDVESQLAGFLSRMRRGTGRVRAKVAISLDGRTSMASGDSQWITGPEARADVQRLRAESCAVLTGANTVRVDDCALTVRDQQLLESERVPPPERRALRVVADPRLTTPAHAKVLAGPQPSLLLHRASQVVPQSLQAFQRTIVRDAVGRLDPVAILEELADRECNEVLLEAGPVLCGEFLRQGLIDQLIVYIAPRLLGSRARPMFELPIDEMSDVLDLRIVDQRRVGSDMRLVLEPSI